MFVQRLDVEVALDDFIGVANDVIVAQELTENEVVSEILMERSRESDDVTAEGKEEDDDRDDENVITVTEVANMAQSLRCFVMTRKNLLDHGLDRQ
jgi:dihydroxyacetone kinase-like predicted kinase